MSAPLRAVVLPVYGPSYRFAIDADRVLAILQALVGGDIEAVRLHILPGQPTGYINEDGKRDMLPVNRRATQLYANELDYIAGTMVLLGPPDDDGNDTSLPEEVASIVLGMPRFDATGDWVRRRRAGGTA